MNPSARSPTSGRYCFPAMNLPVSPRRPRLGRALLLGLVLGVTAPAAEPPATGFIASLAPAQLAELKLDHLTAAQRVALDAAIEAYVRGKAATVLKEEAVSRLGRAKETVEAQIELRSRIDGQFLGWSGHTIFQLANGQTWQQVGTEHYYHPFPEGVEVTIYPVGLGGFRLRLPTGASVPVRRR
jgi:hypothetical protein